MNATVLIIFFLLFLACAYLGVCFWQIQEAKRGKLVDGVLRTFYSPYYIFHWVENKDDLKHIYNPFSGMVMYVKNEHKIYMLKNHNDMDSWIEIGHEE